MTNRSMQFSGPSATPATRSARARDIRGYAVFDGGPAGEAHAMAHRLTDSGQWQIGRELLGDWLASHSGKGSDWLHLQFHMAIFELALGDWDAAYRRFNREVLPAAASSADALTDAPALLWRLALSSPGPVVLPWEPVRRTALAHMRSTVDPFVQLHHLMALAGANDRAGIERWLQTDSKAFGNAERRTLERFAFAMLAVASGLYHQAAKRLDAILPELVVVGGSHAQNQLFIQLSAWAAQKAAHSAGVPPLTTSGEPSPGVVADLRSNRFRSVDHKPLRAAVIASPRSMSTHVALHRL